MKSSSAAADQNIVEPKKNHFGTCPINLRKYFKEDAINECDESTELDEDCQFVLRFEDFKQILDEINLENFEHSMFIYSRSNAKRMPRFYDELMRCATMKKTLLEQGDLQSLEHAKEIDRLETEIFSSEV